MATKKTRKKRAKKTAKKANPPSKGKLPFVKLSKRAQVPKGLGKIYRNALKKGAQAADAGHVGPFGEVLNVDVDKLKSQMKKEPRLSGCTVDPTKKFEDCKMAAQTFTIYEGEPWPQTLQELVHQAAQKVAQEIIQKREEQAKCAVTSISSREAYEHCWRYLSMLSMDGQNGVLGRLLHDIEQGRLQQLDGQLHRAQKFEMDTRGLRQQVDAIQNIKNGTFSVLNL